MGIAVLRSKGSGRAICKICKQLIKKGQAQTDIIGYRSGARIHTYPRECDEMNNALYRRRNNG